MYRLLSIFRQRQHFKNRLKQRNGKIIYLFLAKKCKYKYLRSPDGVRVYKYKNHIFFIQNYQMQTYINKLIPKNKNYAKK